MIKYCIAVVDTIDRSTFHTSSAEVYYLGKREDGLYGFCWSLTDDRIVWYDSAREAQAHIIYQNECVVPWNVLPPAETDLMIMDEMVGGTRYKLPLPGMNSIYRVIDKLPPRRAQSMWDDEQPQPKAQKKEPLQKSLDPLPQKKAESVIPPPKSGKGSKYDLWLRDFLKSGKDIVEINDSKQFGGVTLCSVHRGLKRHARSGSYPVECIHRGDKYFVQRLSGKPEENTQPKKMERVITRKVTTKVTECMV